MSVLPQNVVSVRLFGSMARGDNDQLSDADVLVVVEDRSGKVPEEAIRDFVMPWVGQLPTISWYGRTRLAEMFNNGHLFSWHLAYESRPLWGPNQIEEIFGTPNQYCDAIIDIGSFRSIIESIPKALKQCPNNSIYEMGLLYVCIRNIAMSASWHLCDRPDFTRYSPYRLGAQSLRASKTMYEAAMCCRIASQRGAMPSDKVAYEDVAKLQSIAANWCQAVSDEVEADE